ncbi:MAG: alpha/beta hydrolase [Acidimicrobiaceae bacterium]|nr:alpha/beta hydrolase [Acidimicrobiaceae bacterium]
MATAKVNGLTLGYELIGKSGRPWVITPGGRYTKEDPGIKELAEALAAEGNQVLIWDRPNCGESSVSFEGATESDMQADALAALLRHLDLAPAVIMGGSGGARVSLLTAANHPEVASGLAILWISGGIFGLMSLGVFYCGPSLAIAWSEGMESVANLPDWAEVIERNPENRQRILDQDRKSFVDTMERWMAAYYPREGEVVPGLSDDKARSIKVPTLVFRSGEADAYHTRATSEAVAALIPGSRLVEPPWPDAEWHDGQVRRAHGEQRGAFERWPLLAPQLLSWAKEVLP